MPEAKVIRFTLRKGLDLPLSGAPEQVVHAGTAVGSVSLLTSDHVGVRPTLCVNEGDRVRLGDVLFRDANNPGVDFTAPGGGIVSSIVESQRREVRSVVVTLDGSDEDPEAARGFPALERQELARLPVERVIDRLCRSGLWTALRSRPSGRIPRPDTTPDALFVRAMDTQPLAANAEVVIEAYGDAFEEGLTVLGRLVAAPIYLCKAPGARLPSGDPARITVAEFGGPHPAGLVGTHIHFLAPVGARRTVWYIDSQDVCAIGRLFTTGRLPVERIVAFGGPAALHPRLLRTRVGAHLGDLLRDEGIEGEQRTLSGSVLSGRTASAWSNYLGRHHSQVTVLPEALTRDRPRRTARFTFYRPTFPGRRRTLALSTARHGPEEAMVPLGSFERVVPLDLLVTPLLRALLVQDIGRAEALGCRELEEEDLALCSFVCPSKIEYGHHLRVALTQIESPS